MCYVLENYHSNLKLLRWNLKTNNWFYLKNSATVSTFLKNGQNTTQINFNTFQSSKILILFFQQFYSKQLTFFTNKTLKKKPNSLLSNLNKSFLYWSFQLISTNLTNEKCKKELISLNEKVRWFPTIRVAKSYRQNEIFEKTILTFLNLLTNTWLNFLAVKPTNLIYLSSPSGYKLLPFYNKHFCFRKLNIILFG